MAPLIWDEDIILVDSSEQTITSGKIYAFCAGAQIHVKYLYSMIDGSILVKSLNPAIPDEKIKVKEMKNIRLIGRVRQRTGGGIFLG